MADNVGIYQITGSYGACVMNAAPVEVSGGLNRKNEYQKNLYVASLTGSDAPSWTQVGIGKQHAFVISPLSSSMHEVTSWNTYSVSRTLPIFKFDYVTIGSGGDHYTYPPADEDSGYGLYFSGGSNPPSGWDMFFINANINRSTINSSNLKLFKDSVPGTNIIDFSTTTITGIEGTDLRTRVRLGLTGAMTKDVPYTLQFSGIRDDRGFVITPLSISVVFHT